MRDSVSGTCAMQTTEFTVGPPKKPRHANEKARASQTPRTAGGSSKTEEQHGFLEPTLRGGWKREHAPAVPPVHFGLQAPRPPGPQRQRRQQPPRPARVDERGEFLLPEADERKDADGHRDDRRRDDSRLDRVVRQGLPEGEPRRRPESADPEGVHQVPVQGGGGGGVAGLTWPGLRGTMLWP